jgi:hypothetical protein
MSDTSDPDPIDELSRECDRMEGSSCTLKEWRKLARATIRETRRSLVETQQVLVLLANADILSSDYADAVLYLDAAAIRFRALMSLRQRIDSNLVEVNAVTAEIHRH